MSSLRLLGTVCDSCVRSIKSPAGNVLLCRECSVVCHDSPDCLRALLRICPSTSTIDSTLTLELTRVASLGASLSTQGWRCWSCRALLCAPTTASSSALHNNITTYTVTEPSAELWASVRRIEHRPESAEIQLKRKIITVLEEVGSSPFFSHHLGPVLTPTDFRVIDAAAAVAEEQRQGEAPSPALLCHYSGKFFCSNCHWGDVWCIPGKVFTLGVTAPYPVSINFIEFALIVYLH